MRRPVLAIITAVSTIALTQIASAADLPRKAPAYIPPPPPVISWNGWYLGLNAGYHWGNHCVDTTTTNIFDVGNLNGDIAQAVADVGAGNTCPDDKGFIGGGQLGYNWQFPTNWVVGLEADIQGLSNNNGEDSVTLSEDVPGNGCDPSCTATGTITSSKKTEWLGTLRGRLGLLAAPSFLVYATGGLAYGKVKATTTITEQLTYSDTPDPFGTSGSISKTRVGWTVGGGAEWMFAPKWSLKGEYLYYDLGDVSWSPGNIYQYGDNGTYLETVTATQSSTRFTGSIVRAGINYHF
jgi:outer membrane immunogenic protein